MGYDTYFNGTLTFNKPISFNLAHYINNFSNVRHMERNNEKIKEIFLDWESKCYKGNLGINGEYFIGGKGFMGQDRDASVLNNNYPSRTQPGLWCQWIINDNGELEWDGNEKFYNYVEWLEYLIGNFFAPEGYILNGTIEFQGEDEDDFGSIVVKDNVVTVEYGIRVMSLADIPTCDLVNELEKRGYAVS